MFSSRDHQWQIQGSQSHSVAQSKTSHSQKPNLSILSMVTKCMGDHYMLLLGFIPNQRFVVKFCADSTEVLGVIYCKTPSYLVTKVLNETINWGPPCVYI